MINRQVLQCSKLGTSTMQIEVLILILAIGFQSSFLLMHLGRHQLLPNVLGHLPPLWDSQMEFLPSDFSLANFQLLAGICGVNQ